jgi:hypothetical protein
LSPAVGRRYAQELWQFLLVALALARMDDDTAAANRLIEAIVVNEQFLLKELVVRKSCQLFTCLEWDTYEELKVK